jgi:hypothetical protein
MIQIAEDSRTSNRLELGLAAANTAGYIILATVGIIGGWQYTSVLLLLQLIGSWIMYKGRRSTPERRTEVRRYWRALLVIPLGFFAGYLADYLFLPGMTGRFNVLGLMIAAFLGIYPSIVFLRMYLRTSP